MQGVQPPVGRQGGLQVAGDEVHQTDEELGKQDQDGAQVSVCIGAV